MFAPEVKFYKQINAVVKSCFSRLKLEKNSKKKDLEKVINAFILSHLDYWNVLVCEVLSDHYFMLAISWECGG